MINYHGGDAVKAGFYWNPAQWEIVSLAKKGGALPGTKEMRYMRLPLILLMIAGPVLGGLLVVFLPLIGFVMLFGFAGAKLLAICRAAFAATATETRAVHKEK